MYQLIFLKGTLIVKINIFLYLNYVFGFLENSNLLTQMESKVMESQSHKTFMPRFLINHCLCRMQNSETECVDVSFVTLIDGENKVFQVKSSTRKEIYTCDLWPQICDCWD